eukprot:1981509-Rhodomonas_salina.1
MFPPLPPNGNAFFQQNTVIGSAFGSAPGPPPIQTAPRLGPNKVQNYLNLVAAPGAEKADSGSEVGQTDTFRFQGLTYKRTQINLVTAPVSVCAGRGCPGLTSRAVWCEQGFNNVRLQVPVAQGFLASLKVGLAEPTRLLAAYALSGMVLRAVRHGGEEDEACAEGRHGHDPSWQPHRHHGAFWLR